jgi:hypothetical protein
MAHPLARTSRVSGADAWILGLLVQDLPTGSPIVDAALSAMAGNELRQRAPSPEVLDIVEPWLSVRPVEGWSWIRSHPVSWWEYCGGWIQAGADKLGVTLKQSPLESKELPESNRRLLRIERLARRAYAGRLSTDDPLLDEAPAFLPAPICSAYLAAHANLDPIRALDIVIKALNRQTWESQRDAALFCIRKAMSDPSHEQITRDWIREQVSHRNLFIDAASWLEAAAYAQVFEHGELKARLSNLAPLVTESLDDFDYRSAAMPLIRGSLYAGCPDVLHPYLGSWGIASWSVVNTLIRLDARGDDAWGLVEIGRQVDSSSDAVPDWWAAASRCGQLGALYATLRSRIASGLAQDLPCQPASLWIV